MTHDDDLELGEPVARGGMGTVLLARRGGLPVAVKVLDPEHATEPAFVRAFETEVRAMATLSHPHILGILALGRFADGAYAGCPYAVLERASGSLADECGRHPWEVVLQWLDALLQGLAHAHARGITHRDLKPANVLLVDGTAKIGDFGLARAFEAVALGQHEQPAGTPGYMPDEQRQGRWRDVGPWTDLFALGKLAIDLVNRSDGQSIAVPAGFAAWVSRLRQAEPADRFRRAADARLALLGCGPADTVLDDLGCLGPLVDSTLARTQPFFQDQDVLDTVLPAPMAVQIPTLGEAPLPEREGHSALGRSPLVLGPLAGTIWHHLRRAERGAFEVVLARGSGAARLGYWICHQLHGTGAGAIALATHDAWFSPQSGVAGMMARELRCLDLEESLAEARLASGPLARHRAAMLTVMGPALSSSPEAVALTREERWSLIETFLEVHAEGRLPFLWIDQAEHASELLNWLEWRRSRPGRLLVLVTGEPVVPVQHTFTLSLLSGSSALTHQICAEEGTADEAAAWRIRVERLIAEGADVEALGAAAVQGLEVDQAKWLDVARRARVPVDEGLLDTLLEANLVIPVGLGAARFAFAHPVVPGVVLEALDGALLERLHHAAALSYTSQAGSAIIRAHHLMEAGEEDAARVALEAATPELEATDPYAAEVAKGLLSRL